MSFNQVVDSEKVTVQQLQLDSETAGELRAITGGNEKPKEEEKVQEKAKEILTSTSSSSSTSSTSSSSDVLTFSAMPLQDVIELPKKQSQEKPTDQKQSPPYPHALLLKTTNLLKVNVSSSSSLTPEPDQKRLKEINLYLRQAKPIELNKPEKYQFKTAEWLVKAIQDQLNVFEKSSWKLFHALIFLSNNTQFFETAATKHPSTDKVVEMVEAYRQILVRIKILNLFVCKIQAESAVTYYGKIAENELPKNVSPEHIQLLIELQHYPSKEAYNQYKIEQHKLSGDYFIKQAEMKLVWQRINELATEIDKTIDRLDSKKQKFQNKLQEKQQQAKKGNQQIKDLEKQGVSSYQEEISHALTNTIEHVVASSTVPTSQSSGDSQTDISEDSESEEPSAPANPAPQPPALLKDIEEAIAFSKELNWYVCEATKWLESIQICIKAGPTPLPHEGKKQKDLARFSQLIKFIQTQFEAMQDKYDTHVSQLQEIASTSQKPLKQEAIKLLLKEGKTAEGIIQIEQARAANLEAANFNLTVVEKQWSELGRRIQQLTQAMENFNPQPSNSSSSTYYWYWPFSYKT